MRGNTPGCETTALDEPGVKTLSVLRTGEVYIYIKTFAHALPIKQKKNMVICQVFQMPRFQFLFQAFHCDFRIMPKLR